MKLITGKRYYLELLNAQIMSGKFLIKQQNNGLIHIEEIESNLKLVITKSQIKIHVELI